MSKIRRMIVWTASGIATLILVAVVTGLVLLKQNRRFRTYLLDVAIQSVEESTGARVEVRDSRVTFSGLGLDLYGVVVHGKESTSRRPLLVVDHLGVSLAIDSLFRRRWHLRSVTVDQPVASIVVNKNGANNLPSPKEANGSHTSLFELAVGQAAIHRGEIFYNDRKLGLEGSLSDIEFAAAFDRNQTRYYGDLRYNNGNLQYGPYTPLTHGVDVKFEVTPKTFTLHHAQITTGGSRLVLDASVEDYANVPRLQADYDVLLATRDVARFLKDSRIPAGDLLITGKLSYEGRGSGNLMDRVKIEGTTSSRELQFTTPSIHTILSDLKAHYTFEKGDAAIDNLRAQVLGGTLNGELRVSDVYGTQKGKCYVSLRNIALDQTLSHSKPLQQARLSGRVDTDIEATWASSLKNLVARGDASVHATLGDHASIPISGAVHADYALAGQQLTLHQSYFRTPQSSITLDGRVSRSSHLQVQATSTDLHELEIVAAIFRAGDGNLSAQDSLNLGIFGNARFTGSIGGSVENPQIVGSLEATNLRVKGSTWKILRTGVSASPSSLAFEKGELQAATQGHFAFNVRAGLTRWSYLPASPINVNLSASQLSLTDLQKFVGKDYPVAGSLALNASLHGSRLNPVGQGNIILTHGTIANEPVHDLSLTFHGDGNSVHSHLIVHFPAGTATGDATVDPKTGGYNFQLHADSIRLNDLQAVKTRHMQVAGAINLDASGQGTLENPTLQATVALPELQVEHRAIRNAALHTTLRDHVATVDLQSEVEHTPIKAHGTVGIQAPYLADVHLDTGRIELQTLLAQYSPAQSTTNVEGQTELHLALRGPLQDKERIEAHLEIPPLAAAYNQFRIGSKQPIHVDYQDGTAVLQPVTLEGTDIRVNMQASVPISNPNAATLRLKGDVDLRAAQLLVADLKSSGQIRFDIDSRGIGPGAGMNGQIQVVDASVHQVDMPIGLDHANGKIEVTPTRFDVGRFDAEVGGGRISAKGGITFRPSVEFNLGLEGENVRLRYPQGIRTLLASSLALTGTRQTATLGGRISIEQLSLTPDFDLSSFAQQFDGDTSTSASSITQSLRLNISMQSTSQMNLQSSQVSVHGSANLRVVGTAAQPVVLGRSDLTGGELFFGGQRYVIQSGIVDFLNPVRTEPVLNLHVETKINDYNITLGLQGPVARLHTTYTSDPALPPVDIINLIARGQTTEAAAAQPSQPLSLGAQSLIASAVSQQIGNKIAKVAGISQLQIDPSLGSANGQSPGARIAIQQRVTSSLFVTVATDVTSTQRQSVELEYQLNPRWSVGAVRDQNGGVTGQVHYKRKF